HITNMQADPFVFRASISGAVTTGGGGRTGPVGVPGLTVQLQDTSGNVLATAVTDAQGRYRFNQLGAVPNTSAVGGAGDYVVRLVLPTGVTQLSASPATISVTRGD